MFKPVNPKPPRVPSAQGPPVAARRRPLQHQLRQAILSEWIEQHSQSTLGPPISLTHRKTLGTRIQLTNQSLTKLLKPIRPKIFKTIIHTTNHHNPQKNKGKSGQNKKKRAKPGTSSEPGLAATEPVHLMPLSPPGLSGNRHSRPPRSGISSTGGRRQPRRTPLVPGEKTQLLPPTRSPSRGPKN